jgi:hypothetical protein
MPSLDQYADSIHQAPPGGFWFVAILAGLLAIAAFVGAFVFLKRKRVIEDTPTSLIRSAPQGYIELQGMAELMDGDPIHAPLSIRRCTWYKYKVEHREQHYSNGKRTTRWTTVDQGTCDELFYLIDTSGQCAIDPEGAAVTPTHRNIWYGTSRIPGRYHESDGVWWARAMGQMGKPYRYTEQRIEPGDQIYAIGHFTTHGGAASRFDKDAAVGERLREWKRDQAAMLKRFDENGDGEIDADEWGEARAEAEREVVAEQNQGGGPPPVDVLGRTRDRRRPFVIAAGTEDEIVDRFKRNAGLLLALAVPLLCGAIWAIGVRLTG